MTLLQIVLLVIGVVVGIVVLIPISLLSENNRLRNTLISAGILIAVVGISFFVIRWYNTSTASGIRYYNEYLKNIDNGVEREILIVNESGEEVYKYVGKVDVDDTQTLFCIYFYDQDGISHIIHYGVTDRVFIRELGR